MSIDVVIVSYRSARHLRECVMAVPAGHRVIVIDNASGDDSVKVAEELGCEVLRNHANVGFGRAVNRAVRERVTADHVLLLNPDARLLSGCLDRLVETMDDPTVAVAGPRLRTAEGHEQRPWWPFPSARLAWTEAFGLHRLRMPRFDRSADVAFVVGACFLVRTSDFRSVGGFDERYWLYGEEADLCRRLHDGGRTVRYVADAWCEHAGGASGGDAAELVGEHFRRGYERFVLSHDGRVSLLSFRLANIVASLIRVPMLRSRDARRATRMTNLRRSVRTLLRHPTLVTSADHSIAPRCLVVCSLEAWDEVWRRNQFLVRELTDADPGLRVLFVEPAADPLHELLARRAMPSLRNTGRLRVVSDRPQVIRFRPVKVGPRVFGRWIDRSLAKQILLAAARAELVKPTLWINDPGMAPLLQHCGWPVLYDITDDWLLASLGKRSRERLRRNEQRLLTSAGAVVVCSPALEASKGNVRPVRLIPNAVDVAHLTTAQLRPVDLPVAPVAVYVGTLHDDRIDVDLVVGTATELPHVAFAFVGPDALSDASRERLDALANVHVMGARTYASVPAYLQHADVVIVPHVVSPFTESLDPIKAYECIAVGRPTLATPVAGFRGLERPIEVAPPADFAARLGELLVAQPRAAESHGVVGWADRACAFGQALDDARDREDRPRGLAPPLRVVYLDHTALLSGGELALLRLLPSLVELGVEPHVILGDDGPLVEELRSVGISTEVLAFDGAARDLRRDRVRPGRLSVRAVWLTARHAWKVSRRLRELEPALVHTNSLKSALYGGVAGRLARVPVLWHIRDRIAPDYLPTTAVKGVRAMARFVPSAVIANSRATLDTVDVRSGPRSVAPSLVVMDAVQSEPRVGVSRNGPLTVAIVGRLSPWKGQDVFLDAFAKAFPGGEERALIVGSAMFGEEAFERQLRRQSERLGIEDRVSFLGFQRDVFGVLAGVDVLVHASTVPEPFGQVIIEGMAAGVPVIATAAGGPLEIITHGVNGLLVPPGDIEVLCGWLRRLGASPSLRAELADHGRVRALDFMPERIADAVVNIYGRVVR